MVIGFLVIFVSHESELSVSALVLVLVLISIPSNELLGDQTVASSPGPPLSFVCLQEKMKEGLVSKVIAKLFGPGPVGFR